MTTACLVLTACGSASPAPGSDARERAGAEPGAGEPSASSCDVEDLQLLEGPALASADVDGDGRDDVVRQTTRAQACPGELLVVAGDRLLTAGVLDGPPATEAFVAELGDGTRLLVTRQDHPRGGFQTRMYSKSDGRLVELTDGEGNALVPFVATDTSPATPMSVTCAGDGMTVTEAQVDPGDPMNVDVDRTTYRVEGGEVLEEAARAETVETDRLRQAYPDLAGNAVLEDCRAG